MRILSLIWASNNLYVAFKCELCFPNTSRGLLSRQGKTQGIYPPSIIKCKGNGNYLKFPREMRTETRISNFNLKGDLVRKKITLVVVVMGGGGGGGGGRGGEGGKIFGGRGDMFRVIYPKGICSALHQTACLRRADVY